MNSQQMPSFEEHPIDAISRTLKGTTPERVVEHFRTKGMAQIATPFELISLAHMQDPQGYLKQVKKYY